jgi:hypothetical protein
MDATHGLIRGFDPLAPFAANLLWPIGPEGGHKTHKGCWAWTGLPVASIDAS